MTATDELRKLLDDFADALCTAGCGVKCDTREERVRLIDGVKDRYAQAIAATLGCDDDYEAKMDALLCRLTNGKWSKSRAYDLDFMESCIDEEYEKAYAGESDREAELEALAKDMYENAVDFNFKGWIPYYRDRFAALGIEVEQ